MESILLVYITYETEKLPIYHSVTTISVFFTKTVDFYLHGYTNTLLIPNNAYYLRYSADRTCLIYTANHDTVTPRRYASQKFSSSTI